MQYHEGCATKHLQRYDKKDEAIEDLEKSIHYIEKTIELAPLLSSRLAFVRPAPDFIFETTMRFCDANKINGRRSPGYGTSGALDYDQPASRMHKACKRAS